MPKATEPATNFFVHRRKMRGAATHALVIGVGAYPHVNGGTGPLSKCHDGLRQLSSPPVSARKVAEWLIADYNHRDRKALSVMLLLTESQKSVFVNPKTQETFRPKKATYLNVEQAIWQWKSLGAENPDNLLIFYFCGHWTALGSDMALLLSDYASNPHAPLKGALDFRYFRLAMSRNLPRQQVYFVDACRSSSETLIEALENAGEKPVAYDQR